LNKAHEEGSLFKILIDIGLVRVDENIFNYYMNSNSKEIQAISPRVSNEKNYDYHSSYNDTDLNAIAGVSMSNLDIGKSISQNFENENNQHGKSIYIDSKPSMILKGIEDGISSNTWDDSTIRTYSRLATQMKFDYCLDYIKSNYLNSKDEIEESLNSRDYKTMKRNQQIINNKPLKSSMSDWKINSQYDISKRGLTPPNEVLSVIRNRLGKADAEIQLRSMKILNKKLSPF
jgi:hypothetical protein